MKYVAWKQDICKNLSSTIQAEDFFLLEGKLIFVLHEKAMQVKDYLEKTYDIKVHTQLTRNWPHWDQEYETEMWIQNK